MPARIKKNGSGGATKPRKTPKDVKGSKAANETTRKELTVSQVLGQLLKGFLRVRMMKMTSTWVANDSMNQPV